MSPQDKTDIRPILVAVGLLLGPDDFQIVMDGDNISKSTIHISHFFSPRQGHVVNASLISKVPPCWDSLKPTPVFNATFICSRNQSFDQTSVKWQFTGLKEYTPDTSYLRFTLPAVKCNFHLHAETFNWEWKKKHSNKRSDVLNPNIFRV